MQTRNIHYRYIGVKNSQSRVIETQNVTYDNWKKLQRVDISMMKVILRGKVDCDLLFNRYLNPNGSVRDFIEQQKFGRTGKINDEVYVGHNAVVNAFDILSGKVKIIDYAIIGEIEVSGNVTLAENPFLSNSRRQRDVQTKILAPLNTE